MKLFSRSSHSSAEEWAQIERHLSPAEPASLPPGLHERIMRAVRNTGVEATSARARWLLAWGCTAGCMLVAGLAIWLVTNDVDRQTGVASMPSLSSDLPAGLSTNLVSPLALELAHVEADMWNAAQGLLSALPQLPNGE